MTVLSGCQLPELSMEAVAEAAGVGKPCFTPYFARGPSWCPRCCGVNIGVAWSRCLPGCPRPDGFRTHGNLRGHGLGLPSGGPGESLTLAADPRPCPTASPRRSQRPATRRSSILAQAEQLAKAVIALEPRLADLDPAASRPHHAVLRRNAGTTGGQRSGDLSARAPRGFRGCRTRDPQALALPESRCSPSRCQVAIKLKRLGHCDNDRHMSGSAPRRRLRTRATPAYAAMGVRGTRSRGRSARLPESLWRTGPRRYPGHAYVEAAIRPERLSWTQIARGTGFELPAMTRRASSIAPSRSPRRARSAAVPQSMVSTVVKLNRSPRAAERALSSSSKPCLRSPFSAES